MDLPGRGGAETGESPGRAERVRGARAGRLTRQKRGVRRASVRGADSGRLHEVGGEDRGLTLTLEEVGVGT